MRVFVCVLNFSMSVTPWSLNNTKEHTYVSSNQFSKMQVLQVEREKMIPAAQSLGSHNCAFLASHAMSLPHVAAVAQMMVLIAPADKETAASMLTEFARGSGPHFLSFSVVQNTIKTIGKTTHPFCEFAWYACAHNLKLVNEIRKSTTDNDLHLYFKDLWALELVGCLLDWNFLDSMKPRAMSMHHIIFKCLFVHACYLKPHMCLAHACTNIVILCFVHHDTIFIIVIMQMARV